MQGMIRDPFIRAVKSDLHSDLDNKTSQAPARQSHNHPGLWQAPGYLQSTLFVGDEKRFYVHRGNVAQHQSLIVQAIKVVVLPR